MITFLVRLAIGGLKTFFTDTCTNGSSIPSLLSKIPSLVSTSKVKTWIQASGTESPFTKKKVTEYTQSVATSSLQIH